MQHARGWCRTALKQRHPTAHAGWLVAAAVGIFPALAAPITRAQTLQVCPQSTCRTSQIPAAIDIPILVTGAATLDAVGLDLHYDDSNLEYTGYSRGNVSRGWVAFQCYPFFAENRVRVGGYDGTGFALNGTDTLAVVHFRSFAAAGDAHLSADTFVDDLTGATGCPGTVTWRPPAVWPNGEILVVPAIDSTACCFPTPDGTVLHVLARLGGASATGILGATFRIEVAPAANSASFTWTPAPGATSTGNPVENGAWQARGVTVRFSSCTPSPNRLLLLGTITVQGLGGEHLLRVRKSEVDLGGAGCPVFELCSECPDEYACLGPASSPSSDPIVYAARVNSSQCRRPLMPPSGFISISPEGEPASCCFSTPEGVALAVWANPKDGSAAGIRGASFRIEVSPPVAGASFDWTPVAGVSSTGDPVDNTATVSDTTGVTLDFPACATAVDQRIRLGTLVVHGLQQPAQLRVRRHNAAPQNALCPWFSLCARCPDDRACIGTDNLYHDPITFVARLNDPDCAATPCGYVAIAPATWSAVKKLYR